MADRTLHVADRTLFLAADPLQAYLTVRDRRVVPRPGTQDVELMARRSACPRGTAVGVAVSDSDARRGEQPGSYLVRADVAAAGITRAYQPWHADVEHDERDRWKGYLDDTYNLTLRNLLGKQTPNELRRAEDDRVEARMLQLDEHPMTHTFDLEHLRGVHRHLFQDVYPWAGETRTVSLSRPGGPWFVPWDEVEDRWAALADQVQAEGQFTGLGREDFAQAAAQVYNEVNTIHAFREGNGRTQRTWMDHLAAGAGYELDWLRTTGTVNDRASRAAREGDPTLLHEMFASITTPAPDDRSSGTAPAPEAADIAMRAFGTHATEAIRQPGSTPAQSGGHRYQSPTTPPGREPDREGRG